MRTKNLLLITVLMFAASGSLSAQNNIKYTNFKISEKQKKVSIDWSTDNSASANYFEIQKSKDGINFKTIALVLGADPSQKTCECYGCFDKVSKKAYYRLVHIDTNGIAQISETKLLAKN